MSYGAGAPVFDITQPAQQVVVAAANCATFGIAAVAAGGVLAFKGAQDAAELVRSSIQDRSAARGGSAIFDLFKTGLTAEALPVFRAGLAVRQMRFAEGGSIRLADGNQKGVTYTVLDQRGQALFFVRPGDDGQIELLVRDRSVLPQVEAAMLETVVALARQTLQQQGFSLKREGDNHWTMQRRAADGSTEEVAFVYDRGRGEVTADARTVTSGGQSLGGNRCPNLDAFFRHLRTPRFVPLRGGSSRERGGTTRAPEVVEEAKSDRLRERRQGAGF